ncbi:MAG: DUF481 domain-containing protein [Candidatus Omnitrophica bacterium]|nr:DUF481 domain-containing protein [Candidatus Omnitrophota bacterium]MDD5487679.1 DUF481 domain-containing protein [Candidatus Omnitrophota bacterium]
MTTILFTLAISGTVRGDELVLNNGDRITGEILEESDSGVTVRTGYMGEVEIDSSAIKSMKRSGARPAEEEAPAGKPAARWKREISAGYNAARGNTDTDEFSGSVLVNRKIEHEDEMTAAGDIYYSAVDGKPDAQKWSAMGRYAYSFGRTRKWYQFYRFDSDHDKFAEIDIRYTPSTGVGYWFYDLETLGLFAEIGIGWQHTEYNTAKKDDDAAIIRPRIFLENKILDKLTFTNDLVLYQELEDMDSYRLQYKGSLTAPLYKGVSVRLSVVDEYNASPPPSTEKNDIRITSSLVGSF